jgi:hypothetical protein
MGAACAVGHLATGLAEAAYFTGSVLMMPSSYIADPHALTGQTFPYLGADYAQTA